MSMAEPRCDRCDRPLADAPRIVTGQNAAIHESCAEDLAELASVAIEEAARNLPPFPRPVIDAAAAGFGPVPERVEVTYTPYEP